MKKYVIKLMIFVLGSLPFLAEGMERPLENIQYELSFNNQTGEQPLNLEIKDMWYVPLFQQQINLGQWSLPVVIQSYSWPIQVSINSPSGVISGVTQITPEKLKIELQKNGVMIPQNFNGRVLVRISIYQRAVIFYGELVPMQIGRIEPQRMRAPTPICPAPTMPAAVISAAPLTQGEYGITIFGANKKPVLIQFSTFDKQIGQYSPAKQQLLENRGVIKQSFSANNFPILVRVFEGISGNILIYEDELDLTALNLKDFSYTVSDDFGKFDISYYPQIIHGKEAQALRQRTREREAAVAQPSYSPNEYQALQAPATSVVPREQQTRAGSFMIEFRHESRKPLTITIVTNDGKQIEKTLQPNDSFNLPNVSSQEFPLRLTLVDDEGKVIRPGKVHTPGFKQISIMTHDGWLFINIQSK